MRFGNTHRTESSVSIVISDGVRPLYGLPLSLSIVKLITSVSHSGTFHKPFHKLRFIIKSHINSFTSLAAISSLVRSCVFSIFSVLISLIISELVVAASEEKFVVINSSSTFCSLSSSFFSLFSTGCSSVSPVARYSL